MTIDTRPALVVASKDPTIFDITADPNYQTYGAYKIVLILYDAPGNIIYQNEAFPDPQGKISFDCSDVLQAILDPFDSGEIDTIGQSPDQVLEINSLIHWWGYTVQEWRKTLVTDPWTLIQTDTVTDLRVVNAGMPFTDEGSYYSSFWEPSKFLTYLSRGPQGRVVWDSTFNWIFWGSPMVGAFNNPFELWVEATNDQGTVTAKSTGITWAATNGALYAIPVNPNASQLDFSGLLLLDTVHYNIFIKDGLGNTISEKFKITPQMGFNYPFERTRVLFFVNSLGGLDVVPFTGNWEISKDFTVFDVDKILPPNQRNQQKPNIERIEVSNRPQARISTFFPDFYHKKGIMDLMMSKHCFLNWGTRDYWTPDLTTVGRVYPILPDPGTVVIKEDGNNLSEFSVMIQLAAFNKG